VACEPKKRKYRRVEGIPTHSLPVTPVLFEYRSKRSGRFTYFISILRFHERFNLLWSKEGLLGWCFLIVEADSEFGDLVADSSSCPGVAGAAYLPSFEGGASLWPCGTEGSTSCVGMAYRPKFAGGTLRSPLCVIESLVFCPAEAGIDVGLLKFDDMFAVDGNSWKVVNWLVPALNLMGDMAPRGGNVV
jgi:hypothetical protein